LVPVAIELAALPPMPMRMPGPPKLDQQRTGGEQNLLVSPASITQAACNHDGLVILAGRRRFCSVFTKVTVQVGSAEFVVKAAAKWAFRHDLQWAGVWSGLP
jgi:hypothetical protein